MSQFSGGPKAQIDLFITYVARPRTDLVSSLWFFENWYFPWVIKFVIPQVQTCGERIVLFVLNCLVCGFVEGSDSENGVCFLPHSAGELAKIFWHHREAVAFYTYKNKGECPKCHSICILLSFRLNVVHNIQGSLVHIQLQFCISFQGELKKV